MIQANFNILELVSASSGSDVTAMVVRDDGQRGNRGRVRLTLMQVKLH